MATSNTPANTVYHRLDPKDRLLAQQTYEKLQVIFLVVKNLQVEVQELRAEQKATRAVLLALVGDPQVRHEAEAVVREFMKEKYKE